MRRIVGTVLVGLAAFLLAVGLLAQFYAPGQLKKTPLDINTLTTLSGEGTYLGAPSTPVSVWKRTQAVADSSDSDVVVMRDFTCVMKDPDGTAPTDPVCVDASDERLITASEDLFATDRVTAEAVNDAKYIGTTAEPHEGLVNKFPFDVQKKSYPFWDGDVGKAVDIDYKGEKTLFGLNTYEFSYTVKDVPITIAEGIEGTYDNVVTVYVDPKTGSIVKSGQDQQQYLADGTPAADVKLTQTDDSVKDAVDEAKTASAAN